MGQWGQGSGHLVLIFLGRVLKSDFFTERRYHWGLFDLKILDISVA